MDMIPAERHYARTRELITAHNITLEKYRQEKCKVVRLRRIIDNLKAILIRATMER